MGQAIPHKGGSTVGICEVAGILGKSYPTVHNKIQYSQKFMREVPNRTPRSKATYLYTDVIRFKNLSDWGI